jgi:phage recombination protein Bet
MPDTVTPIAESGPRETSLVVRTAERYGIDPGKLLTTLKATAFKSERGVSNEQMMALLIVAERHRLDPFTKQIYAFPDKFGGIVPVVGVDGWLHIVNTHPQFDGMHFDWDDKQQSMTCTLWRKDRGHPIVVTEYLAECRRNTDAWKMTHRMMRHKSLMQCARYAFGFSGIYDEEEAEDIVRGAVPHEVRPSVSNAERVDRAMRDEPFEDIVATEVAPPKEPEPEPPTLEHFAAELAKADDSFVAEMLLEEARDFLSDEEMSTLAATFTARFTDTQEDNRA